MPLPEKFSRSVTPSGTTVPMFLALALLAFVPGLAAATEAQIPGGCVEPVIPEKATALEREAKLVGYLLCLEEQASTTQKIEAALHSRASTLQGSAMRQSMPPSMMRPDRRASMSRPSDNLSSDRMPPSLFR